MLQSLSPHVWGDLITISKTLAGNRSLRFVHRNEQPALCHSKLYANEKKNGFLGVIDY